MTVRVRVSTHEHNHDQYYLPTEHVTTNCACHIIMYHYQYLYLLHDVACSPDRTAVCCTYNHPSLIVHKARNLLRDHGSECWGTREDSMQDPYQCKRSSFIKMGNKSTKDWRPNMTAQSIAMSILSILCGAGRKSLPMDNAAHAQSKPGQKQDDWVYHDDNCQLQCVWAYACSSPTDLFLSISNYKDKVEFQQNAKGDLAVLVISTRRTSIYIVVCRQRQIQEDKTLRGSLSHDQIGRLEALGFEMEEEVSIHIVSLIFGLVCWWMILWQWLWIGMWRLSRKMRVLIKR